MGEIFLSTKEAKRLYVMERVLEGSWTASEAAKLLGLSIRQVFRLKGEMAANGEKGLVHKNRGRKPKHAVTEETRQLVIAQALGPYKGASYEHMAELLAERDGIRFCAKTIGRILKGTGIVHPHTHRSPRRFRRRERSSAEGMLIQIDASTHDWLEGRGPWLALHGAIDDATGKILALHFRPTEDDEVVVGLAVELAVVEVAVGFTVDEVVVVVAGGGPVGPHVHPQVRHPPPCRAHGGAGRRGDPRRDHRSPASR